ncbi:Bug family tripartite tricarboxylate transporter substrate binding protein [Falsiroseomonas selenitidurans]|uniref:Tripartite tricarboxylate transporter substrate binding protein n=1 Tax=Falsiroseomonas selenitidurans TaxID=2716335 RepID=A0ABX1E8R4_9PROT|nr:tripartite tricarboxylate transporter substrate binding protein [Falsiroseomonas selenitidurans]NKC33431.1 tripartite tricarboxylate transporter substrate binding protein [Falsiroseomonas selenitidurans]
MNITRRALGSLAAAGLAAPALAQPDFPSQSVRIIVPFAPGGATDVVGRILAPGMQEALGGRTVLVENRGGAAGIIGAEALLAAPRDGHAVALFTITNAVLNAGLMRDPRLDPRTAFTPVSLVATLPMVLTVGKHVRANTLQEFVGVMKEAPGRLTYGSAGAGSINHLGAHLFNLRSGTQALHVPYRGAGLVYADLIGGNVDWLVEGIASQAPHVRSGNVRALAVLARERNPALPEVPTAIEQGFSDFEIMNIMAVFAASGTPAPAIARLEGAIRTAVAKPDLARRLREAGAEPAGSTTAELQRFWDQQLALWLPVVAASGVRLD